MPTKASSAPDLMPDGPDAGRSRGRMRHRVLLSVLGLAIGAAAIGALVVYGWMIDEAHFDRPTEEFNAFQGRVAALPGVDSVEAERWVEAPTFSDPTSMMSVSVQNARLPGLLEAACSTEYPDPVTWSIRVVTPAAGEVLLFAAPTDPDTADGDARCPDFGFDAVRLVDELDHLGPGLAIQPTIWEDGMLTLIVVEDGMPTGFTHLLPLLGHADELMVAAGLDAGGPVELNAANLGLVLEPGESERYVALLAELGTRRAVSSFWADSGGRQVDGIDEVQIVAPDEQHAAIEETIRSSGLHIADLPVRFLEQ